VRGPATKTRQVERDIDNVRHVIEAAQEFQKLMDFAIARVEEFHHRHAKREAA
jgi:hypothetical protein